MKKVNTSIRLKQVMSESHLRQVDILERTLPLCAKYDVKMNKSDISQYVSGKVEPNQDKLFVLSLALNVSEGWLMGYDVPKSRSSSSDPAPVLAEQEAMLLLAFRKLNSDGKSKVIEYTKDLSKIEKYQDSSPVKESLEYPSFGVAPPLAAEARGEYSSDLEAQLRKDADEIVRKEYEKFAKAGSVME